MMSVRRKELVSSLRRLLVAVAIATVALTVGASTAAYAASPAPGSYTGEIPGISRGLVFYVSANGKDLQDVYIPTAGLHCTGEGTSSSTDHLEAAEIPLESNGSFTSTTTQKGILEGRSVVFAYKFSGQFNVNGEDAAGTYDEEITFEGSTRKCTTNSEPWSATRDAQPTQTTSSPPPGSYTGEIPGISRGLVFYVSANGKDLQDVYIPTTGLQCMGEGTSGSTDHLEAAEIPLESSSEANASFAKTTTQKSILEGHPVVFTYTFSGHFHSINNADVERAAGTYREEITFEGSTRKCATNNQSFSATRDAQPTQTTSSPPPGSYTGEIPGISRGLVFYVSANGKDLQDVYIPSAGLQCMGEGTSSSTDHLEAAEIPLESSSEANASFAKTTTQKGILEGHPVVFTYTFSGHFHSINKAEVERAAGTYREEITFEGSTRKCATNNQSFSATRDAQPTQTTSSPPPGSYTGEIPGISRGLVFYVSANGKDLQDVYIPSAGLQCMGEGTSSSTDHLEAAEIKVKSGVSGTSFTTKKATAKGILEGHPVLFTYTFSGHFHSINSSQVERAAGTYREEITFEGSTRRCTTNNQSFSATRDAQPTQTTSPPPPGSYTGEIPGISRGLTFDVSSNSRELEAVSIPTTDLQCTGEGASSETDKLEIGEVAISKKGGFNAGVTRKGEIAGAPVLFAYTFSGQFHSINSSEVERAAGSYREEITYEDSTRRCTTNNESWSATRN